MKYTFSEAFDSLTKLWDTPASLREDMDLKPELVTQITAFVDRAIDAYKRQPWTAEYDDGCKEFGRIGLNKYAIKENIAGDDFILATGDGEYFSVENKKREYFSSHYRFPYTTRGGKSFEKARATYLTDTELAEIRQDMIEAIILSVKHSIGRIETDDELVVVIDNYIDKIIDTIKNDSSHYHIKVEATIGGRDFSAYRFQGGKFIIYTDGGGREVMVLPKSDPEFLESNRDKIKQSILAVINDYYICSECGKTFKNPPAGAYFAGRYCKDCWENEWKAIEAAETYN